MTFWKRWNYGNRRQTSGCQNLRLESIWPQGQHEESIWGEERICILHGVVDTWFYAFIKTYRAGASLVAQWLRIHLPMQGTWVRALVREDPTCQGTTKPCAPQLLSLCSRAPKPQLLSPCVTTTEARASRAHAPQQEKPPQWEAHAPQRRVAPAHHN